jgi:hypothetical protein
MGSDDRFEGAYEFLNESELHYSIADRSGQVRFIFEALRQVVEALYVCIMRSEWRTTPMPKARIDNLRNYR